MFDALATKADCSVSVQLKKLERAATFLAWMTCPGMAWQGGSLWNVPLDPNLALCQAAHQASALPVGAGCSSVWIAKSSPIHCSINWWHLMCSDTPTAENVEFFRKQFLVFQCVASNSPECWNWCWVYGSWVFFVLAAGSPVITFAVLALKQCRAASTSWWHRFKKRSLVWWPKACFHSCRPSRNRHKQIIGQCFLLGYPLGWTYTNLSCKQTSSEWTRSNNLHGNFESNLCQRVSHFERNI